MKLNEFFNKSKGIKKNNKKIVTVVNEKKENLLASQIVELQQQLANLQQVNIEKDLLNERLQSVEIQLKETSERGVNLETSKALLEDELKDKEALKIENQSLQANLKDTKGTLSFQEGILEQAQRNNLELNTTLQNLTHKVETLQKDEQSFKVGLEEAFQRASAYKHELSETDKKFNDLTEIFQATEVKYKEAQKNNHVLKQTHLYWEQVAHTLEEENRDLDRTRGMLKQLADDMKNDNQEKGSAVRVTQKELNKLRDTIQTMTTHIDSLIEENTDLSRMSTAMKEELARPKYMSMAAIERSEGFKMPMGGSIKHYLGHGKPTLLKFKNGGSENDN